MNADRELLRQIAEGDDATIERLLPLLYGELHALASRSMERQGRDHTLQPTALVHEAYLRIAELEAPRWQGRRPFLSLAAKAMRAVLVDHARARGADKRGAGRTRLALDEDALSIDRDGDTLLALHEALDELSRLDAQLAKVVELRFFGGLTVEETAEVLDVSPRTVKRGWRSARAWLERALSTEAEPDRGDG